VSPEKRPIESCLILKVSVWCDEKSPVLHDLRPVLALDRLALAGQTTSVGLVEPDHALVYA